MWTNPGKNKWNSQLHYTSESTQLVKDESISNWKFIETNSQLHKNVLIDGFI